MYIKYKTFKYSLKNSRQFLGNSLTRSVKQLSWLNSRSRHSFSQVSNLKPDTRAHHRYSRAIYKPEYRHGVKTSYPTLPAEPMCPSCKDRGELPRTPNKRPSRSYQGVTHGPYTKDVMGWQAKLYTKSLHPDCIRVYRLPYYIRGEPRSWALRKQTVILISGIIIRISCVFIYMV